MSKGFLQLCSLTINWTIEDIAVKKQEKLNNTSLSCSKIFPLHAMLEVALAPTLGTTAVGLHRFKRDKKLFYHTWFILGSPDNNLVYGLQAVMSNSGAYIK